MTTEEKNKFNEIWNKETERIQQMYGLPAMLTGKDTRSSIIERVLSEDEMMRILNARIRKSIGKAGDDD
jgi:hypothetical protein